MQSASHIRTPRGTLRIGSVSFLNARPLVYELEEVEGLDLHFDVPSRLLDGLRDGCFDVALLPVIDYQRMPGLKLLTSGGIASDGPTLTVRIFSPVSIEQITTLACDPDSHTSVALARVMLAERYGTRPEFVPLDRDRAGPGLARLLIGDKVVCEEPGGLSHQLDLGQAWKEHTGLPFVFAAWMARPDVDLRDLPDLLEKAKQSGLTHVDQIITRYAVPRGWPPELAREYLTQNLQYDIGPRHLEAIRLFHQLAFRHGLVPQPPRDLDTVRWAFCGARR